MNRHLRRFILLLLLVALVALVALLLVTNAGMQTRHYFNWSREF